MSEYESGPRGGPTILSILMLLALAGPAPAQSARQECSVKYQAAKAAGTLEGQTWPQFFSRCMIESKAPVTGPQSAPAAAAPPAKVAPEPVPAPAAVAAPPPAIEPPSAAEVKPAAPSVQPAAPAPSAPAPAAAPVVETAPKPAQPVVNPLKPPTPPTPTAAQPSTPATPPKTQAAPPKTQAAAPSAAQSEASGSPVFPTAIAPAYAKENPPTARKKTCLDQFNANKPANANGGLKWIQKGGGYYSECNKRLKGET